MSQVMLEKSEVYAELPDTALTDYFRNAGDMLAEEATILGAVIHTILAAEEPLTHKAIILRLISEIESTRDVIKGDVLRKTLEIVVDHTMDDI